MKKLSLFPIGQLFAFHYNIIRHAYIAEQKAQTAGGQESTLELNS